MNIFKLWYRAVKTTLLSVRHRKDKYIVLRWEAYAHNPTVSYRGFSIELSTPCCLPSERAMFHWLGAKLSAVQEAERIATELEGEPSCFVYSIAIPDNFDRVELGYE